MEEIKNNKLYVYREWCNYHIGFYDDKICIASNIDEACELIIRNLDYLSFENDNELNIIKNDMKNEIKEFDLEWGLKLFK